MFPSRMRVALSRASTKSRRFATGYFAEDQHVVSKAVGPPIFEDVQPSVPSDRRPRKAPQIVSKLPDLSQRLDNVPDVMPRAADSLERKVTQLSNGVYVVSQLCESPGTCVGLFIETGASSERGDERGSSLLLEQLAFGSAEQQPLLAKLSEAGNSYGVLSMRDVLCYMVETMPENVDSALDLLGMVQHARYDERAIELAKSDAALHVEMMANDPGVFVPDALHGVAFGANSALGQPMMVGGDALRALSGDKVAGFLKRSLSGSRVVLSGVGIEHERLLAAAERHFGALPSLSDAEKAAQRYSPYVGGQYSLKAPGSDLTVLGIGFESPTYSSNDAPAAYVLQKMLGGGKSWSTGGPGKGMHSMFYKRVLARSAHFEECVAANEAYNESGLFHVLFAAKEYQAQLMAEVVLAQLISVTQDETLRVYFERAKALLKGSILMSLEQRQMIMSDQARNTLIGRTKSNVQLVNELTFERFQDFVRNMLMKKPSIVAYGNEQSIQSLRDVDALHRLIVGHVEK